MARSLPDDRPDGGAEPPPPPGPVSFHVSAARGIIREVRHRVMDVANHLPFSPSDLDSIETALGEATLNAVRHGSPRGEEDRLFVKCRCDGGCFVIEVTDQGTGFSPSSVPSPIAEELRINGYGLCLMRGLMDEVEFVAPPQGGTTVRMMKRYAAVD